MKLHAICLWMVLVTSTPLFSQTIPAPTMPNMDSTSGITTRHNIKENPPFKWTAYIVPTAFILYGVDALKNHRLKGLNNEFKDEIYVVRPHRCFHLDNQLQTAPGITMLALNVFGVKGRHNVADQAGMLLLSNIILNTTVYTVKKATRQMRPDGSSYSSFPSGHTAESFAGAELLRLEYGSVSPWYAIAGYAAAATTGYLRMYNNRHWFSDVVAGAGVGMASSELAYWLYPILKNAIFKSHLKNTVILPSYQNRTVQLNLVKNI